MKHPPRNGPVVDWLNTIWETDLPSSSKLVACNLRRFMTGGKDFAYPGIKRICAETGLSERCVQAHLKTLCSEGWLVQNGHGPHGTVRYDMGIPPAMIAPPATIAPPQPLPNPPATIADNKVKEVIGIKGWDEWVAYRKEIKKTLSPSTIKQQVKKLEKYPPDQQQAMIDQSISNGWVGLFPIEQPKEKQSTRKASLHDELTDVSWAN